MIINYNDFTGYAVGGNETVRTETDLSASIDAQYNYWGHPSEPTITTNARGTGADVGTLDVDYEPWLHTDPATVVPSNTRYYAYNLVDLTKGWNIWSTPIALDEQADTWGEYEALGVPLDMAGGNDAYWFNASTPGWETVTDSYVLRPVDAIYIKVASNQEAPILFSPTYSAPSKDLYAGWNLVSASYFAVLNTPSLTTVSAVDALASVYNVAGANNLGYSQVVSPAVNQTAWNGVRGTAINNFTDVSGTSAMIPTKGYWVFMTNAGTLAGTVFTPVSPLQ